MQHNNRNQFGPADSDDAVVVGVRRSHPDGVSVNAKSPIKCM